jgi:hypothetical protein
MPQGHDYLDVLLTPEKVAIVRKPAIPLLASGNRGPKRLDSSTERPLDCRQNAD